MSDCQCRAHQEYRHTHVEREAEVERLTNENDGLQADLDERQAELERLREEKSALNIENERIHADLQRAFGAVERLREQVETWKEHWRQAEDIVALEER